MDIIKTHQSQDGHASKLFVAVLVFLALIVVAAVGAYMFSESETKNEELLWGESSFLITIPNSGSILFSKGTFSQIENVPAPGVFSRVIASRALESLAASSDPRDHETALPSGIILAETIDPQPISGTDTVVVRKIEGLSQCNATGECTPLYNFGRKIFGPVSYAIRSDLLVVIPSSAPTWEAYTRTQENKLKAPRLLETPYSHVDAIAFDQNNTDRLFAMMLVPGESKTLTPEESLENETLDPVTVPTTTLRLCVLEGLEAGTLKEKICAMHTLLGDPRLATLMPYEK